jgi:hypothetical protein
MAACLPHKNGMLEYWNVGGRVEITHFNCKKFLQTHHSIIQNGAKPLSSMSWKFNMFSTWRHRARELTCIVEAWFCG